MYVDKNLYFINRVGLADGTTLWATLWAHTTTNIGDVIDLEQVTNRRIAEGGYVVWQCHTVPLQAANDTTFKVVCSAAVGLGTPTVLWEANAIDHAVLAAWTVDSIIWVVKLPNQIPLRYLGVSWYPTTTAWTAGEMDIYLTPEVPVPYSGYIA